MKWGLVGAGVLAGLVVVLLVVGWNLPSDHVARMSIALSASPDRVWELVADVEGTARWRPSVSAIDVSQRDGEGRAMRFVERGDYGDTPLEVVARTAPERQVVRVLDEGMPFGGTWTWELAWAGDGTRLVITEEGFVRSPLFRVLGRLFFPPTATMDGYLRALAAELGDNAEPVVLQER